MIKRVLPLSLLVLFWAVPAQAQQRQIVDRIAAVVNDEAITQSEVSLYLRPLYEQLRQHAQGEELAKQVNEVRLKLLNQLIEDRLVYQEAKARGINVDEAEIDGMIEELKDKFPSVAEFEKALLQDGVTVNELRERYQRQIAIKKLHDLEIRSHVVVSPQDVEEYYKKRQSEFAEEESIRIRSITVRKTEEAENKGLADENAKKKLETIEARIKTGESFEKLAQELSEDTNAKEAGMIGWIKRGEMLPSIESVLFESQPGAITPILETSAGYHLFKIEEKKVGRVPPLEEIRDKIRNVLFHEEAQKRFEEWMNQLKSRAYISIR